MPDLLPGMVRRSALVLWHAGRKPIHLDRLVPLLRPQDHGTEIIVEEQFYYARCGEQDHRVTTRSGLAACQCSEPCGLRVLRMLYLR